MHAHRIGGAIEHDALIRHQPAGGVLAELGHAVPLPQPQLPQARRECLHLLMQLTAPAQIRSLAHGALRRSIAAIAQAYHECEGQKQHIVLQEQQLALMLSNIGYYVNQYAGQIRGSDIFTTRNRTVE